MSTNDASPNYSEWADGITTGCTNHGCLVREPRGGMGTNAICQCLRRGPTAERIMRRMLDELKAQREEIARLKNALLGLAADLVNMWDASE